MDVWRGEGGGVILETKASKLVQEKVNLPLALGIEGLHFFFVMVK